MNRSRERGLSFANDALEKRCRRTGGDTSTPPRLRVTKSTARPISDAPLILLSPQTTVADKLCGFRATIHVVRRVE